MALVPIEQAIADNGGKTMRLIVTDMHGTLGSPGFKVIIKTDFRLGKASATPILIFL
jgi:hypothetical protein